jgi:hypothetical protein
MGKTDELRKGIADTRQDMSVEVHEAADQVTESARRRPVRWASVGTAMMAAAAATVGVVRWRRNRRTPQGRAARAWRSLTKRFSR